MATFANSFVDSYDIPGVFWYVGQRGQRADVFSIAFWLAEVIFWTGIVAYLYWLQRRGVLR